MGNFQEKETNGETVDQPLPEDGKIKEQARLLSRRRFAKLLLALPILAVGIEKCVSERLEKDYAKQFLGSWEGAEGAHKILSIKQWDVTPEKGPMKRLTTKNGLSMTLVQTVEVDFQGLKVGDNSFSIPVEKGKGGIYKLDRGEFALVSWSVAWNHVFEIKIEDEHMLIKCITFGDILCSTKNGKASQEADWGRLKRKK